MTTNVPGTRPTSRSDEPVRVETTPTPTPVTNSSGVGGVAVYDQDSDGTRNSSTRPSASMIDDPAPVRTQSSSSAIAWIIGIVILIILAYFLWQMFF